MTHPIKSPRKLIEVALPLDVINAAAAREKSIRHGHPSTLHLWWARRPLAAARAVIFAQMVNDPGYQQGGGFKYGRNKAEAAKERQRLFKIIEDLVQWENTTNEVVLERARAEIRRSWREVCELNQDHPQAAELFNPDKLPALHDPFAGGGSIPLEAQRLGLEAYASDLNPVAVLINKAMIEIPPKFAGQPPVNPESRRKLGASGSWKGAQGLAEDVRYYGAWMREEAQKRIGHLYPPIEITAEMAKERPDLKSLVGQKLTVIAWLWARTVKSPNPAFSHVDVPLASTFILSNKEGKEAYVQLVIEGDAYQFTVRVGKPPAGAKEGTKLARANFRCLISGAPISGDYIKKEGLAGRMGARLMAIVVQGAKNRFYLPPIEEQEIVAYEAQSQWQPDLIISGTTQFLGVTPYGMSKFSDLFTARQTLALVTFVDLVNEARDRIYQDAIANKMLKNDDGLSCNGQGAVSYSEAVSVYLAFACSRACDYWGTGATWEPLGGFIGHVFTKQAIPMIWDYVEGNPFSSGTGNWDQTALDWVVRVIINFPNIGNGNAEQIDATEIKKEHIRSFIISTDPPYYDNVPYSDISDYFYVWLRRSIRVVYPNLFSTIATPKSQELVAFSYRHPSKLDAQSFFLSGMCTAMKNICLSSHPSLPVTIYYAFKQTETEESGISSTGWGTFLEAVINSGFVLSGTWPLRTERANRSRGIGSNALASSIILVCRKRPADAPTISRREFIRELNAALPEALDEMTRGSGSEHSPVAPVDLSQAIIGPGMAIFSKYAAVLEADGTPMKVRTALQLINRFLAEDDFDPDSQFCLHWFEQNGWRDGAYGDADVLARSKAISITGLAESGVVHSGGGKVQLRKWADYAADWNPPANTRPPVWESLHHLIRALRQDGETVAGRLLIPIQSQGEAIRQLAYRLYTLCERQGRAEDARAYNELITSWNGIETAATTSGSGSKQAGFSL